MAKITERLQSRQHQLQARRLARHRESFALFHEMGAGKTKTLIDEFCEYWADELIDCVLVVTAKGNYANWPNIELPKHMPEEVFWDSLLWRNEDTAANRLARARFVGGAPCLRILVVNIEALAVVRRCREFCAAFVRSGRCYMVVDESNIIGNEESRGSRECRALGSRCRYRRIATGTPGKPESIWGQFRFLGEGLLGFSSIYGFRKRHAVMENIELANRTIQRPFAYVHLDELADKIAVHSHRVLKEDCLDLPPKIYMPMRAVRLHDDQERIYRQMAKTQVADIDSGSVATAEQIVTQIMRLQQILCGHLMDDAGVLHRVPQHRVEEMMTVIEGSGSASAIVWCAYRHDVVLVAEALREAYGSRQVLEYHGGTSDSDRAEAVRHFQDGDARFLVATSAAARGLTLTRAGLCVYYSNQRQLLIRQQSEDRAHRDGLQHAVTYVDLVVPGMVDEKIVRAYRRQIDLVSAVIRDGHREWVV